MGGIKMGLIEVVLENVDSIYLVQDMDQWHAYVLVVLNLTVATFCWE
jgi:hypothetical protein